MLRILIALVVFLLVIPTTTAQEALKLELPATWKLPSLEETAKLKLLELPGNLGDPLDIAIRSDVAELPKDAVIVAEAAADKLSWLVKAIDNPAAKAPRSVNLATITRDGQTLFMAWSQPLASAILRRQVTNCLLHLRLGTNRGTMQLREPVIQPTFVLNLNVPHQTVEFDIADLPATRVLRLELRQLNGFTSGTRVRDESKSVAINKRATIEIAGLPGAEIRAIMQTRKAGTGVAVSIKAVFREAKEEWDLNLPALDNLVATARQTWDNVIGRDYRLENPRSGSLLERAIATAKKIEDDLESLNRNRPTEIAQVNTYERTYSALVTQQRVANKQVQTLRNVAAECSARFTAAPKVKEVLLDLHERATLTFAVCAETGDTDIVLGEASGVPQL